MTSKKKKITLIVPVYNEQDSVVPFHEAVRSCKGLDKYDVEILFINDGSADQTEERIKPLIKKDHLVRLISFTRNFGKEAALLAGLQHAHGDAVIPIDVDLQDPIEVIPQFIKEWNNGADVVLGKRRTRKGDGWLKRTSAGMFYSIHNKLSTLYIEPNVGDFRLISAELVPNITKLRERNLFMKALLNFAGGKQAIVEYDRPSRAHGQPTQSFFKLIKLAISGIVGYSTFPLRIATYLGVLIALLSLVDATYISIRSLIFEKDIKGYSLLLVVMLSLVSAQFFTMGILGEYVGRIYIEVKDRPRYLIKTDSDDK